MALQTRIEKALEALQATSSKAAAMGAFLYPSRYNFSGLGNFVSIAPRNFPYYKTDPMQSSAVMNTVAWIQRNFGQAHLKLEQTKIVKGKEQETEILQHPFLDLVWEPNPYYNYHSFWSGILLSYFLDGNGYAIKVRNARGMGVPTALYYEPHWSIKPHWPADGSAFIDYYVRSVNGTTQQIPPENVLHFRNGLNPANPRYGLSPLKAALLQIFTDEEVSLWVAALCKNMAIPGVIVSPEQSIGMNKEKAEAIKQTWKRKFGGDNRGEPLILDFPGSVTTLGYNPSDMDFTAISNKAESRISGALGVPAIVAGLNVGMDASTYNNLSNLKKSAFEECLEPCWEAFECTLEDQLLVDFTTDESIEVCFDTKHIRALQENETERQDRERKNFESGAITLNEFRAMINLDADPQGDYYVRNTRVREINPDQAAKNAATDPPVPTMQATTSPGGSDPNAPAKSLKKKSLVEWEGLTLSREPTELEKACLKSIDAAMSIGKQSLEGTLLTFRDELIVEATKALATLAPANYHSLVLSGDEAQKARIEELLTQTFRKGQELVQQELAYQRRLHGKGLLKEIGKTIKHIAEVTIARIINEVQTRAIEIAAKLSLLHQGELPAEELKADLEDTSTGYVSKAASGATNAALAEGRKTQWEESKDEVSRVIYSSVLDANTCDPCESADGQESETGDDLPPTPNPECEGGLLCRCLWIFVLKSEI